MGIVAVCASVLSQYSCAGASDMAVVAHESDGYCVSLDPQRHIWLWTLQILFTSHSKPMDVFAALFVFVEHKEQNEIVVQHGSSI